MKSKDQQLLEKAYQKVQLLINEQEDTPHNNERTRVYVICWKGPSHNPELIFETVKFSEQEAHAWVQGNTFPDTYTIKVYEQGPGGVVEIK